MARRQKTAFPRTSLSSLVKQIHYDTPRNGTDNAETALVHFRDSSDAMDKETERNGQNSDCESRIYTMYRDTVATETADDLCTPNGL